MRAWLGAPGMLHAASSGTQTRPEYARARTLPNRTCGGARACGAGRGGGSGGGGGGGALRVRVPVLVRMLPELHPALDGAKNIILRAVLEGRSRFAWAKRGAAAVADVYQSSAGCWHLHIYPQTQ